MTALNFYVKYHYYPTTPQTGDCQLFAAINGYDTFFPGNLLNFTVGANDPVTSTFLTAEDCANWLYATGIGGGGDADSMLGNINTARGTSYTKGILLYIDEPTNTALAGKYNVPTAQAHIADGATDAATNAPTNLNVITTLLGSLTGEVNATNAKQNALATKYNDLAGKYNTLISHLVTLGLQA